jgi:hypothetical protein
MWANENFKFVINGVRIDAALDAHIDSFHRKIQQIDHKLGDIQGKCLWRDRITIQK